MIQMLSSSSSNIVAFLVRSTHFEFPTLEPLIKSGLMASDQEEIPLPPPASDKTVFFSWKREFYTFFGEAKRVK